MRLIAEKYRQLQPTVEYLNDEVVMAQAWKKTHAYIRNHNWYADTLALDVSALSLEENVRIWAETAVSSSEKLNPMELVPAAKSDPWIVHKEKGWIPKRSETTNDAEERKDTPPLRPLAHLAVRDQTWATAAMLCMADIVETAQGDCSGNDVTNHQRNKVYSYGNRLLCDWKEDGKAWFRWGNSQLYRKFFTDYQNFLRRPVVFGRDASENYSAPDRVYVVSLDLSKFYDNINRQKLVSRLKKLCKKNTHRDECSEFWLSFKKITDWRWGKDDKRRASDLNLSIVYGRGIPQGLIAAGFYANVYMLDFDKDAGSTIGHIIPKTEGIYLHDYCRYVDDLRLVVSVDEGVRYDQIAESVVDWLSMLLLKHTDKNLLFNPDKTCVTALSDLDNKGSLSERVAQLQSELSGPADRDVLDSTMGALEGLLTMSTDNLPTMDTAAPDAALVRIAKFDHDIRTDTLKRFAANRLEIIMRNKRKIDSGAGLESVQEIDNQSELLAKKLLWAWMQDPSLASVLRKSLEIYPSAELAEPVFEALLRRCSFTVGEDKDGVTAAMADYLMADLFRSCIDFHGYFQRVEYPRTSDPAQLLELACRNAQKVLATGQSPHFVERQALLLLAVNQKPASIPEDPSTIHQFLHVLLAGKTLPWKNQPLALYEVVSQITGMLDSLATQLIEAAVNLDRDGQERIFDELAKRGGPFWLALWRRLPKSNIDKAVIESINWAAPLVVSQSKANDLSLDKLLSAKDNPFMHEAALIKLAMILIEKAERSPDVFSCSPSRVVLKKRANVSWAKLWQPGVKLSGIKITASTVNDPRFSSPMWLADDDEARAIYWVGCMLRAAAVGVTDFTGNRWKSGEVQSYKGLRTGWYKRRMGMMHAPEALVGEFSTLSSWSAELMMKSLQWPGFESTHLSYDDVASFDSIESLRRVLKERLKLLDKLYCEAIETPALVTRSKRPPNRHENGFRLVSVQQLLPRTEDFTKADPKLDTPELRAVNRDHLARICQLTYRTLQANLTAEKKEAYPGADLIVFPELAVHLDDQDLIKRLADKTQSIVFAGLGLQDHDGRLINVARWFIPDYRDTGRQWVIRDQGKYHPTKEEKPLGVKGYRPCQHIIEIQGDSEGPFFISGAICYDSTDLKLASDLKDKTDLFVIVAHNKDVRTFDAMASALNYHMYQHVVVVNKGEFGGSTIQAPFKEQYDRLISHAHGTDQISINVADLDLAAFRRKTKLYKKVKTRPAG